LAIERNFQLAISLVVYFSPSKHFGLFSDVAILLQAKDYSDLLSTKIFLPTFAIEFGAVILLWYLKEFD